jgi:hypothetical protein
MDKTILCFVFLFFFTNSFSQINEEIKTSSDLNTSNDEIGNYGGGSDLSGCLFGLELIFEIIDWGHKRAMGRYDSVKRINSLELEALTGKATPRYWAIVPKLSFSYGVFASDVRLYQSMEQYKFLNDKYATLDWQLIKFNFLNIDPVRIQMGTGFMYEFFSSNNFAEHTLNVDVFPANKWEVNLEYRTAYDLNNQINVRNEANIAINHVLGKSEKFEYLSFFNYTFAQYYKKTEFNLYSLGLKVRFLY